MRVAQRRTLIDVELKGELINYNGSARTQGKAVISLQYAADGSPPCDGGHHPIQVVSVKQSERVRELGRPSPGRNVRKPNSAPQLMVAAMNRQRKGHGDKPGGSSNDHFVCQLSVLTLVDASRRKVGDTFLSRTTTTIIKKLG